MLGFLRRTPGYRLMIALLVLIGVGVWAMLALGRGGKYEIDPAERYCIETAAGEATAALSAALPMRKVLLMPLAGDDGFVADALRERLRAKGGFEIVRERDLGAFAAVVEKIKTFVRDLTGSGRVDEVGTGPAVDAARAAGAPAVLFGKVLDRGTAGGRTVFVLALRAVKVDDGSTLVAGSFEGRVRRSWSSATYVGLWIRSRAGGARLLVWLGLAALVPVAAVRLTRPLLAREHNAINAAILGALALVDAAAAWLLLGLLTSGAALVLVILAALAGGAWNYVVCERLSEAAE